MKAHVAIFHSSDLNILDLKTSATGNFRHLPLIVLNSRMHPASIAYFKTAKADYAMLANDYTFDCCEEGPVDEVNTMKNAKIELAGAGETPEKERRPTTLRVLEDRNDFDDGHEVHIFAASDHLSNWTPFP